MTPEEREALVAELAAAFGAAADVTPAEGQPLHVLLPEVELPDPWTPSPARAITVWGTTTSERPQFYIDSGVTGEDGQPPQGHSPALVAGEAWNGFSFNFTPAAGDPVRMVQQWLTRFTYQRT